MKDFMIIGNMNAISYKYFYPYMFHNKVRTGKYNVNKFIDPNGEKVAGPPCRWFTTMERDNDKSLDLKRKYTPYDYPKYDNYNAIECSRVKDIPVDYDEEIGVSIGIIDYMGTDGNIHLGDYDFEMVGGFNDVKTKVDSFVLGKGTYVNKSHPNYAGPVLNGKEKYARIIIKKI